MAILSTPASERALVFAAEETKRERSMPSLSCLETDNLLARVLLDHRNEITYSQHATIKATWRLGPALREG